MDLIQLKLPPDKLPIIADAIERDLTSRPEDAQSKDLRDIIIWMRYRHTRWVNRKPARTRK